MTHSTEALGSDRVRWTRLTELFDELLPLSPTDREHALARLAPADAAALKALLAADGSPLHAVDDGVGATARLLLATGGRSESPGQHIGPYQIHSLIGRGGMGSVYVAERTDVGSRVALKIVWHAALSPALRDRFLYEQRILASLRHPNIVALYDAGIHDERIPWFAMELVEGESLRDHVVRVRLPVRARLSLFGTLCDAVQAAHQRLVVHGDLKPGNVLVDASGSVRLLDFGVADRLDAAGEVALTRRLTPAYAAPERRAGAVASVQHDVFALGVMLWELMTGERPSIDPMNVRQSIRTSLRTSGATVVEDWRDLDRIIARATAVDPSRRYPTVEALRRDVSHYLRDEPIEAHVPTPGYRLAKFVRRRRRGLLVASVLVAIAAFTGSVSWRRVRAEQLRADAEAARTARIQEFMLSLFSGSDDVAGSPDSLRVVTLLDEGVREADALGADPSLQAALQHALGSAFRGIGGHARADSLLSSALAIRERVGDRGIAVTSRELALLHADRAQFDSAVTLARRALALARSDADEIAGLDVLGRVHELAGRADSALIHLRRSLALRSTAGDTSSPHFARLLIHIANNEQYRGALDAAELANRRVLALPERAIPRAHPLRADAWVNLGSIERDRGQDSSGIAAVARGTALMEQWYGVEHPATAAAWGELSRAHFRAGHWNEADSLARRSLTIRERVYGAYHPLVANNYSDLANVANGRGDFAQAIALNDRVIEIYRRAYNNKHYLIGLFLGNRGTAYSRSGRPELAERSIREGLAMYEQTLPPSHVNFGIHRAKLARALLEQRRFRESVTEATRAVELFQQQPTPPTAYLSTARGILLDGLVGVGDTANVRRVRAEIARADTAAR
jgi:eukaryotic-like serine/threonine-protein kinase